MGSCISRSLQYTRYLIESLVEGGERKNSQGEEGVPGQKKCYSSTSTVKRVRLALNYSHVAALSLQFFGRAVIAACAIARQSYGQEAVGLKQLRKIGLETKPPWEQIQSSTLLQSEL